MHLGEHRKIKQTTLKLHCFYLNLKAGFLQECIKRHKIEKFAPAVKLPLKVLLMLHLWMLCKNAAYCAMVKSLRFWERNAC